MTASDIAGPAKQKTPSILQRRISYAWYAGVQELEKRFSASLIGGLWLVLGPALLMLVYWVVFDRIVGVQFTDPETGMKVPFLAAFAVGFFNYLTFAELVGHSANWFRSKRKLLMESDVPVWSVFGILVARAFIQYAAYLAVTIAICLAYRITTYQGVGLFLLASIPVFLFFSGVGLISALLGLFFADVKEIMPVVLRVLFYVSSITFPLTAIPDAWQWVPMLNPLTWAVELNRDLLLWGQTHALYHIAGVLIGGVVVWLVALFLYVRLARLVDQVV